MKTVICRRCKTEFDSQYGICPTCGKVWKSHKINLFNGKPCYICAWIAIGLVLLCVMFHGVDHVANLSAATEPSVETNKERPGELIEIDGEYQVVDACYSHVFPYGGIVDMSDTGEVVISLGEKPITAVKYQNLYEVQEEIDLYYGGEDRYEIEYVYSEFLTNYNDMIWDITQNEEERINKVVVITADPDQEDVKPLDYETIKEQFDEDHVEAKQDSETEPFISIGIKQYDASKYIGKPLNQVCDELQSDFHITNSQIQLVSDVRLKAAPGVVTAIYPYEYNSLTHATEETTVVLYYYPEIEEGNRDVSTEKAG